MSLEQSLDKLTAAIEAATGVLVALGAAGVKPAADKPAGDKPATTTTGKGKPAATKPADKPADDGGLGGDDGGLGGGDEGLGGDETTVTGDEAKAAVLAYRDKLIKLKGKEEGLSMTRTLMKKHVASLDDINDDNAAAIKAAFDAASAKVK